jgi:hypothetical protein
MTSLPNEEPFTFAPEAPALVGVVKAQEVIGAACDI